MKKTTLALAFMAALPTFAQESGSPVLVNIGNHEVSRDEFVRTYTKNNQDAKFDSASIADYMKLFIDYKIKVFEAESLGMDTLASFKSELSGYRSQLEKPYFTDERVDDSLFHEAYEHMQWDVKASHILVHCAEDASEADTLKAFMRASELRERVAKGEDFAKVAEECSEDPSAKRNGGNLGYFTAFTMIYDFEKMAYATEVGGLSPVFRTKVGYHFLTVHDKRPNRGQVHVAQILLRVGSDADEATKAAVAAKARMISDTLANGADWASTVLKYSDDKGTAENQGILSWFGTGAMVPEFENAAFALDNPGDISGPVQSSYGWHIIKLLEKKPVGSYEESMPNIKNRISRDARSLLAQQAVLKALKAEYGFKEDIAALEEFASLVDTTVWAGQWSADKAEGHNKTIFSFADTVTFTQSDFAELVASRGQMNTRQPVSVLVRNDYQRIVQSSVFNYERTRLESKYPDFRNLLQEYHDGILLFNLTDQMVWTRAVKDTAGLESFYEEHKQGYMWGDRVEVVSFSYDKSAIAGNAIDKTNKTLLSAMKKASKTSTYKAMLEEAMAKLGVSDSILNASGAAKIYSKSDNADIDNLNWVAGTSKVADNGDRVTLYYVAKTFKPMVKTLKECKGTVTSEYQNVLEKEWLEQLRAKYEVKISEDVLKSLFVE